MGLGFTSGNRIGSTDPLFRGLGAGGPAGGPAGAGGPGLLGGPAGPGGFGAALSLNPLTNAMQGLGQVNALAQMGGMTGELSPEEKMILESGGPAMLAKYRALREANPNFGKGMTPEQLLQALSTPAAAGPARASGGGTEGPGRSSPSPSPSPGPSPSSAKSPFATRAAIYAATGAQYQPGEKLRAHPSNLHGYQTQNVREEKDGPDILLQALNAKLDKFAVDKQGITRRVGYRYLLNASRLAGQQNDPASQKFFAALAIGSSRFGGMPIPTQLMDILASQGRSASSLENPRNYYPGMTAGASKDTMRINTINGTSYTVPRAQLANKQDLPIAIIKNENGSTSKLVQDFDKNGVPQNATITTTNAQGQTTTSGTVDRHDDGKLFVELPGGQKVQEGGAFPPGSGWEWVTNPDNPSEITGAKYTDPETGNVTFVEKGPNPGEVNAHTVPGGSGEIVGGLAGPGGEAKIEATINATGVTTAPEGCPPTPAPPAANVEPVPQAAL